MIGRPSRSSSTSESPRRMSGGEERVLEELDDVRVVEPHPVGVHVLAVVDVLEVVVVDEVEDAVRGDVPAAREADLAEHVLVLGRAGHDAARRGRGRPPCRRGGRGCAAGRRCAGRARGSPRPSRYSLAMLTNSSWSVRKRRTSAARRPIWVAVERSLSSTPPWRKRCSASASSASGVSSRSSAFFRKVDLSSLIQLWMQSRISSSRQVLARDPEGGLGRLRVGGPRGRAAAGRLSSPISSSPSVRAGTVERRRRSASSTPFQQRWLIILRPEPRRAARGRSGAGSRARPTTPGRPGPARRRPPARAAAGGARRSARCRSAIASRSFLSSARNGPLGRAGHRLACSRPRPARRSRPAPRSATPCLNGEGVEARAARRPGCRGRCAPRTRPGTASPAGTVRITSPRTSSSGRLLAAEELVDPVEAVELLGALLQVVEDAVDRLVGAGSCRSRSSGATTPRRERPSTRRTRGARVRTCRTCSVRATVSCLSSQPQSTAAAARRAAR